jgi:hypothetical protein
MMQREPLRENLIDELTRLVGRPSSVLREALSGVVRVLSLRLKGDLATRLAAFPMTAWPGLAPHEPVTRDLWSAVLSPGLTPEETFTALAIIDDHVRRRYGTDAWTRLEEWGPQLLGRYGLATPATDLDVGHADRPAL